MKILAVDDETEIRIILQKFLVAEGYEVVTAENGKKAVDMICEDVNREIKLILLDINMPVMDGIEACSKIREITTIPIIFLTAYSDEESLSKCFQKGADDYVVKPLKKVELTLRINSLFRRCYEYRENEQFERKLNELVTDKEQSNLYKIDEHGIIHAGDLTINTKEQKVHLYEKRIPLTYTEYSILCFLAEHAKNVYSISDIYENIWKEPFLTESANTVMVHIRNLRKKINIEDHSYVNNIWGKGYYFD